MAAKYRETPAEIPGYPTGIPFIVGNEAAERFSFHGMRVILFVFMTQFLLDSDGSRDVMSGAEATSWYHLFVSSVYFLPLFGAVLSDAFWGKYRTIMALSAVYCLGHLALAIDNTRLGLAIGLTLIAIGAGGVKPCVSAHIGDQFGPTNKRLLPKVFNWFYFATNLGAGPAMLLTPWLLELKRVKLFGAVVDVDGPSLAFAVPGILMLISTIVFWLGRRRYVHIPPAGMGSVRAVFSRDGLLLIRNLLPIYLFVAIFWSLYDQTGSTWVDQAKRMDRHFLGVEWLPSQIQSLSAALILVFVPLFAYGVYPLIDRFFPLTALRKISIGLFVTVIAFAIPTLIEMRLAAGDQPNIIWQIFAYVVLTAAEVMVSIPCLEFSYTQAPNRLKSFIMSLFLMSLSAGNAFTSAVNYVIQDAEGNSRLSGPDYFWFFTGLMLLAAIGFIGVAFLYRPRMYVQGADG